MVNLFRRHRQPLLIVFTIFAIFTFVIFYNLPSTRGGGSRTDVIATLYGRGVTETTHKRIAKHLPLAGALDLDQAQSLAGNTRKPDEQVENFVFNTLVVRHEAEELGILSASPSETEQRALDDQIFARVQALPRFQKNGVYDSSEYNRFVQFALAPNGLGVADLLETVADQIRLEKVRSVVAATIGSTTTEVKNYYGLSHGKLEVSVVRLKLDDFKAAVKLTEEDTKKLFEERKESLKTPEKRKVKFAVWAPPAGDKLEGPAKIQLQQTLAGKAQEFAQAMTVAGANFEAEAAKAAQAGAVTGETPLFEAGKPPAELEGSPQAAAEAFRLSAEQPNSDVVSGQKGYFVLQFAGAEPARPLTYEEAKPDLEKQLREERGLEAMNLKAAELRTKIDAELKGGKTFAEAATAAGATAEKLAPFSMSEPPKNDPEAGMYLRRAFTMNDGELSEFTSLPSGGVLMHLDQKMPVDLADYDRQKGELMKQLQEFKQEAIFRDWLRERYKAANLSSVRG